MNAKFFTRIDAELKNALEKRAKEEGKSLRQALEDAIRFYLSAPSTLPKPRIIRTLYDGSCLKCGNMIPKGSIAIYIKPYLFCLDHVFEAQNDKIIVNRILKKRQLDREIKALQNERDRIAEEIEAMTSKAQIAEILKDHATLHRYLVDLQGIVNYGVAVKGAIDLKTIEPILNDLLDLLRSRMHVIRNLETIQEEQAKRKIKKAV